MAGALAYLVGAITGILFLVIDPFKSDRFVRFHAFQSIFFNLAWIAFARGKVASAEARLGEAAATFTEVGDTGGLMWTLGLLSFVRYSEGRFDEAVDRAGRVLRESERRGDR